MLSNGEFTKARLFSQIKTKTGESMLFSLQFVMYELGTPASLAGSWATDLGGEKEGRLTEIGNT